MRAEGARLLFQVHHLILKFLSLCIFVQLLHEALFVHLLLYNYLLLTCLCHDMLARQIRLGFPICSAPIIVRVILVVSDFLFH